MEITITDRETGAVARIDRSVTTQHPQWVHGQLGTESESELQHYLDQCSVDDWYDANGRNLGPDCAGITMTR